MFYKISKYLLYAAPFAAVIVTPSTLFPFIVGKYTFFKVVIELALASFVLGWGFEKQASSVNYQIIKLFKSPLVIAVSVFVAIFTLSGFTGVNPSASFWSNFERGEGSFLLLHFYVYFLLLLTHFRNKEDWSRFFGVAITSGILVMLYGVLAAEKVPGFVGNGWCERFAGSLGNPAYIGTYSIFMLFYTAYLIASGNWLGKFWRTWLLPLLLFIGVYFSVFLLLSQTRGGLFGLGVGVIAGLIFLSVKFTTSKWRRTALGVAAFFVIIGSLGIQYRQHIDLAPWCKDSGGGNRILDVSLGGETITTRFALWHQAIEAWKERPILGWGPENFSIAFEKYYNPIHKVWFDRAHNIFFDYLVFSGTLGLLSFIGIFIVFYFVYFKNYLKKKNIHQVQGSQNNNKKIDAQLLAHNMQDVIQSALLFALPIAYLIQGLVLFDVLPIYINLFLFLAFASWRLNLKSNI